jgi:heme/copper-type cytochrome/quinol oxidase subunit 1
VVGHFHYIIFGDDSIFGAIHWFLKMFGKM